MLPVRKIKRSTIINQNNRKDILTNILLNRHLDGKRIFNLIMNENNNTDERRQGWIFETLCQILIILKF
jgi:hypothetical protein